MSRRSSPASSVRRVSRRSGNRSSTVDATPASARARAVARPATPAPTITTAVMSGHHGSAAPALAAERSQRSHRKALEIERRQEVVLDPEVSAVDRGQQIDSGFVKHRRGSGEASEPLRRNETEGYVLEDIACVEVGRPKRAVAALVHGPGHLTDRAHRDVEGEM